MMYLCPGGLEPLPELELQADSRASMAAAIRLRIMADGLLNGAYAIVAAVRQRRDWAGRSARYRAG